jgi:2-polyprenyl-6-methoxyphenol hydroxylase-like FAD-dependent oxidoreductase
VAGDVPPTDEAGYLAFARSLSAPYLAEVLEAAQAIGPIHSFQRAENRWKHYENLPKYVEGLLVMGDATFAPNPVYGQGMSSAALGAKALQKVLARHGTGRGLSRKFQAELAAVVSLPWQMATGEDRRWPIAENQGTMPMSQRMLGWWVDRVQEATLHSPAVADAFYRVAQLVDPLTALFAAPVLWEVLRCSMGNPQPTTQLRLSTPSAG